MDADAQDAALQVALRASLDQLGYDDEERAQLEEAERLSLAELHAGAPRRDDESQPAPRCGNAAAAARAPLEPPRAAAPRAAAAVADGLDPIARAVAREAELRRRAGLPDPPQRRPAAEPARPGAPSAPPRAAPQEAAAAAAGARHAADEALQAERRAAEAAAARARAAAAAARLDKQHRREPPPPPRMLPFNAPPHVADVALQAQRQLVQEQARALRSKCCEECQ
jgi:hypothetical protein